VRQKIAQDHGLRLRQVVSWYDRFRATNRVRNYQGKTPQEIEELKKSEISEKKQRKEDRKMRQTGRHEKEATVTPASSKPEGLPVLPYVQKLEENNSPNSETKILTPAPSTPGV
jgi:hypothetical protein